MRRIRDRAGSECLREANSLLCQLIQRRSLDPVVPITMNVVRAQSVDGDQKNVPAGRLVRPGLAGCAAPKDQMAAEEYEKAPHRVERIIRTRSRPLVNAAPHSTNTDLRSQMRHQYRSKLLGWDPTAARQCFGNTYPGERG